MELSGHKFPENSYDIEHLMQNGKIQKNDQVIYNDAVFQYITAASEVQDEVVSSNAVVKGQRITTI